MRSNSYPNRSYPLRYIIIHLVYVTICLISGAISRALPISLGNQPWSLTRAVSSLPTTLSSFSREDGVAWRKSTHWVKCIIDSQVDQSVQLGCTQASPLQKRSVTTGNYHSTEKAATSHCGRDLLWRINMYPCWFEMESQSSRLMCAALQQTQKEIQEDDELGVLTSSLKTGLPIYLEPELRHSPGFDPATHRHVSIYTNGEHYNILLMDTPRRTWPLELFLPTNNTEQLPSHSSTKFETGNDSPHKYTTPLKSRQAVADSRFRYPQHPYLQFQGLSEHVVLVRCWFQLSEVSLLTELSCSMTDILSFDTQNFNDEDWDRNPDDLNSNRTSIHPSSAGINAINDEESNRVQEAQDSSDTVQRSSNSTKRSTDWDGLEQGRLIDIVIDRWFLCWDGRGLKMLCEIPDWYTENDQHPQAIEVRKAIHRDNIPPSIVGSPFPNIPLHFLVDPTPNWRICQPLEDSGPYGMACRTTIHKAKKHLNTNQNVHDSTATASQRHPLAKRENFLSAQFDQNTTSTVIEQRRVSAFGKMGETFAYFGFFTILAVFTIVSSWLAKHLFIVVYDGLENWTASRRSRKRLPAGKDFDIHGGMDISVPPYVSRDSDFQEQVHMVAFPQSARIDDEVQGAISTTGIEAVEGNSDSVKRKKAATRSLVAEKRDP